MDDTLPMGLGDSQGHLFRETRRPHRGPGRAVELLVKAAAADVFQLEKRQAIRVADMVNPNDKRMLEPSDDLGLGYKPSHVVGARTMPARIILRCRADSVECGRAPCKRRPSRRGPVRPRFHSPIPWAGRAPRV